MTQTLLKHETIELVRVEVGKNANGCGHVFYMTRQHYDTARASGKNWFCPVCGVSRAFTGKTEEQKRIDELSAELREATKRELFAKNNAVAERKAREHTERQLRSRKGINTRLRNRIKHGVCPCCNRSFENLQRHMSTQHPAFNADDGEK